MPNRINSSQGNSPIARAAARTLRNLQDRGNARERRDAAEVAVDQFVKEHGSSDEATSLNLACHLAASKRLKVGTVVRENLMRMGLELTANGLGGSGAPLAAAALKLAELGRDEGEKNQILKAGYDRLAKKDPKAKAHPFSRDVLKSKNVPVRKTMLGLLASEQPGSLHDQASSLIGSVDCPRTTASLGGRLIDDLAEANPENYAYILADKSIGSCIFTRVSINDASEVVRSFLKPGEPSVEEAVNRIGEALPKTHEWETLAERVVKHSKSHVNSATHQKGRAAVEASAGFTEERSRLGGVGSQMTGVLLQHYTRSDDNGRPLIAALAQAFDVSSAPGLSPPIRALRVAEKAMPSAQWRTALSFTRAEIGSRFGEGEHLARTFLALKDMPSEGDPVVVAAMSSKISGSFPARVFRDRDPKPPHDLHGLKNHFQSEGSLIDNEFTRRALQVMISDAEAPEVREYAQSLLARLDRAD